MAECVGLSTKKTKKEIHLELNPVLTKILDDFWKDKNGYDFLFESRKKGKPNHKAISRQQAYNIMKETADHFDIENFGCHTLRKTFGYHHYQRNKDIEILRQIFGHSNPKVTAYYIGINQDMINDSISAFAY